MKNSQLKISSTRQKGRKSKYDDSFKRMVARQYLSTGRSLSEVANQFGVEKIDVSNWKKRFGPELCDEPIVPTMTEQEAKEVATLQKQIEALKKQLEYEQMRNFAWETMADLAKEELGIDIIKNYGAKQPKE